MKTLVVISDTHGSGKGIEKMRSILQENDFIVHLGDGFSEGRKLISDYPEKAYACTGNCDLFAPLPDEGELEVEGVKILYCHGHKYGVKSTLIRLAQEAKKRDCDLALYGHTHTARIDEIDGVMLVNPGSLRYPAGEGGSYAYLVVNGKKITPVIVGESVF